MRSAKLFFITSNKIGAQLIVTPFAFDAFSVKCFCSCFDVAETELFPSLFLFAAPPSSDKIGNGPFRMTCSGESSTDILPPSPTRRGWGGDCVLVNKGHVLSESDSIFRRLGCLKGERVLNFLVVIARRVGTCFFVVFKLPMSVKVHSLAIL